MYYRLLRIFFALVCAATGSFLSCSPTQVASGGGTETVIGSVVTEDGSSACGTLVRLYPADYNPGKDVTQIPAESTGDSGKYSFANVTAGAYNIIACDKEKSTRAIACGIEVGHKAVTVPVVMLHAPGTIKIALPDSVDTIKGYAYIPGSNIMKNTSSANGFVFLDSVPSGMITSICYGVRPGSSRTTVIRDSVYVVPNDTTVVPYVGWRFLKKIHINTTPSGAGVAGNVAGFPMLVRLNSANFDFGGAKPDGSDLRFAKSDGTPLPYQIERWNTSMQQAEIWVRIDTVFGNDSTQAFLMCWGNAAGTSQSSGSAVFDTGSGFVGAWHFGENGTVARSNSAQTKYSAVPGNFTGNEHTTGIIGGADSLNGTDEFFSLDSGLADWANGITYSVWAYPTGVILCATFMDFGNGTPGDNILFTRLNTTDQIAVQIYGDTSDGGKLGAPSIVLNQWQHFAFSVKGNQVKIYRNGALVLSDTSAQAIRSVVRAQNYFGKNDWAVPGDSYYQGVLDEVEISNMERSADWLKLSYESQRENSTTCKIE
jgi:Concanavalin A-like lectin/glucanases superfamily/Domain of unknown function (DUF2341)